MRRSFLAALPIAALGVGVGVGVGVATSGCWAGPGSEDEGALPGSKKGVPTSGVAITGAGATLPYPLYTRWIADYTRDKPALKIDYQSIGSGGGIRQITARTIHFGATDAPMTDEQLAKAPGILHIPTAIGAVVLTYNLPGVPSGLKLTGESIAGIFLGTIARWNDPAIQGENPGVQLPDRPIIAVHRSDGSGTTRIFVDYLSAVSPAWKSGPGDGISVSWPSGLGAKGNEGVSGLVAGTPGAIGYVELVYAAQNHLSYADVRGASGAFVTPTIAGITAAAASAKLPDDLRVSIVDAEDANAYPIAGLTWILIHQRQDDAARGRELVAFLRWALHEGQARSAELHYAPLPAAIVERADALLDRVTGPDERPLLPR